MIDIKIRKFNKIIPYKQFFKQDFWSWFKSHFFLNGMLSFFVIKEWERKLICK